MASVVKDPNGRKRIQWCVGGGERRTLRLGEVSLRQAEAVKVRIEQVLASQSTGVLDHQAQQWLEGLSDEMHGSLARLGLIKPRASMAKTLGGLMDEYFANLSVKDGTRRTYQQARDGLNEYFGENKPLADIMPLDCDRWVSSMRKAGLADATVAKRIKTAKQFFKAAIRWKMIKESPLVDIRAGACTNRARMRFISHQDIEKVLDACPDAQWRLIVCLSRYGGLRCPSEVFALKWTDIDFARNRFVVRSCKTEHFEGKDQREVPLFPELRDALLEAFHTAAEGEEYVIAKHRLPCGNLRTQMLRIVARAGLKQWPKPFHNLRSSRQTELCEVHPTHVVCRWLGNSPSVAIAHYLQVTDEHFEKAVAPATNWAATDGTGNGPATTQTVAPVASVGKRRGEGANVAA